MSITPQTQKRLNKIAVLLDRHLERIEIQAYYTETLLKLQSEDPTHKLALAEAMRLELYHTKELGKLREEYESLTSREVA